MSSFNMKNSVNYIARLSEDEKVVFLRVLATLARIDGNFDEDWGDCQALTPVLHHGRPGRHTVEIIVLPAAAADPTPFYLMALIVA